MKESYFTIKIPGGSTASGLAKKFFTDLKTIQRLNPQITNINLIQAGAPLKLLKLSSDKAPASYKIDFQKELQKLLFAGGYNRQKAEEKLGKQLEILYPSIDVWPDVYAKVPEAWIKKLTVPFVISKKEIKPKVKESAWSKVGSFISDYVVEPMQKVVKNISSRFFAELPDTPDPQEVFDKAIDIAKLRIFEPAKDKFIGIMDKIYEVRKPIIDKIDKKIENFTGAVIKHFTVDLPKWYKEDLDREHNKLADVWVKMAKVPVLSWTGIGKTILAEEEEARAAGEQVEQIRKSRNIDFDTFLEEFANQPTGIMAMWNDQYSQLSRRFEKGKEELGFDFELKDGQYIWNENAIQANVKARQEELLKNIGGINPLDAAAVKVQTDLMLNIKDLGYMIGENAKAINDWMSEPENLKSERIKDYHKLWTEKLGQPDNLRALDPTLLSWDENLSLFGRSLGDAEKFYEEQIPIWWSDLEKTVPKDLLDLLQKSDLSDSEKNKVEELMSTLSEDKSLKVIELIRMLDQANTFVNVEQGIWNFTQDPESWQIIQEFIEAKTKPDSPLHKLVANILEKNKWIQDHEVDSRQTYLNELNQAKTVKDIEGLEKGIQENKALSSDAKKAWLDLFDYNKALMSYDQDIIEITHNLEKCAAAYERSLNIEMIEEQGRYIKKLNSAIEKSVFHYSKEDFLTMLPFVGTGMLEASLPVPVYKNLVLKRVETPSGPKDIYLPQNWVPELVKVKDVFKTLGIYYNKIILKKLIPITLTAMATYADLLKFSGEEPYVFDYHWYGPEIRKAGEVNLKTYKAIQECVNLPSEKFLPNDLNAWDALHSGQLKKYWTQTYRYYASPEAYETINIGEDTKVHFYEGKVSVGPYTFETLANPEQLFALNPQLKDSRIIPGGTALVVPKFSSFPQISDFWKPDLRYQLFKDHPVAMTALDAYVPNILLDPFTYIWEWDIIKRASISMARGFTLPEIFTKIGLKKVTIVQKGVKGVKVMAKVPGLETFTVKAFGEIGTAFNRAGWELKMQRFMGFQDELYRFFTGKAIRPDLWPNWAQKVLPRASEIRAAFFKTTLFNSLNIKAQFSLNASSEFFRDQVSRPLSFLKLQDGLRDLAKKTGRLEKFDAAVLKYIADPTMDPGAAVMAVLRTLNLDTNDIFELGRQIPFLKEPLSNFINLVYNKNRIAASLRTAFELTLQKASPDASSYFWNLYDSTITEGGKLTSDVWRKSFKSWDEALGNFKLEYLKKYKGKNLDAVLPDVQGGEKLFREYLNSEETNLLLYNKSKFYAEIPDWIEIRYASKDMRSSLTHGRYKLVGKDDGGAIFYIAEDAYKLREPQIIVDLYGELMERRLIDLDKITYATIGNQLKHTKTGQIDVQQYWDIKGKNWIDLPDGKERIAILAKRPKLQTVLKEKTYTVFEGPTQALKLKDAFVSEFLREIQPKISPEARKKISAIFKDWIPEAKKQVAREPVGLSHWEYDMRERIPDLFRDDKYSPWSYTSVIREPKKTYEEIIRFYKEAGALDMMKDSVVSRRNLNFYFEVLSKRGATRLSPVQRLHLVLLEEFGTNRSILSPFSRDLLLGDFISSSQADSIMSKLGFYMDNASSSYLSAFLKTRKEISIEKVMVQKELLTKKFVINWAEEIQKKFPLKAKEIPFQTLIPGKIPHIPSGRVFGEEIEDSLTALVAVKSKALTKSLKKLDISDRKKMIAIFKEIDGIDEDLIHIQTGLLTQVSDSIKLTPEFQREIAAWIGLKKKEGKAAFFLIADKTKRDLAIIEFLQKHNLPYKIYKAPITKARILTKQELVSVLNKDNIFYSLFNTNNYFTPEGSLKILSKSYSKLQAKFARVDFFRELTDSVNLTSKKGKEFINRIIGVLPIKEDKIAWEALAKKNLKLIDSYNLRARKVLNSLNAEGISLKYSKKGKMEVAYLRSEFMLGDAAIQEGIALQCHGQVLGNILPKVKDILRKEEVFPKGTDFLQDYCSVTGANRYSSYSSFEEIMNQQPKLERLYKTRKALEAQEELLGTKINYLDITIEGGDIDKWSRIQRALGKQIEDTELDLPAGAFKTRRLKSLYAQEKDPSRILSILESNFKKKSDLRIEKNRLNRGLKNVDVKLTDLERKIKSDLVGFNELLLKNGSPNFPVSPLQTKLIKQFGEGKVLRIETARSIEDRIAGIESLMKKYDQQISKGLAKIKKGIKTEKVSDAIFPIEKIESDWVYVQGKLIAPDSIDAIATTLGKKKLLKGTIDWKDLINQSKVSKKILKIELDSLEKFKRISFPLQIAGKNKIKFTAKELWDFANTGIISSSLKKKMTKLDSLITIAEKKLKKFPGFSEGTEKFLNMFPDLEKDLSRYWIKGKTLKELERILPLEDIGKAQGIIPSIVVSQAPKKMDDLIEVLNDLEKKRILTIIDVTPRGELSKIELSGKFQFRVVHIPELAESRIRYFAGSGGIPCLDQVKGLKKIREIYLNNPKIAIWDNNLSWAEEVRKALDSTRSTLEKNYMKAYTNLFLETNRVRAMKGFPGTPFIFPESIKSFKSKYFTSNEISSVLTRKLKPGEAIEASYKRVNMAIAYRDFEFELRKLKKIPLNVRYEAVDIQGHIPVLIIANDNPSIYRNYLNDIADMAKKQKCILYLSKKNLTKGEITISDFLKREKIPFKQIDLNSNLFSQLGTSYPTYLYSIGKKFDGIRTIHFNLAIEKFRVFKPIKQLQEEFYSTTMKRMREWYKDMNRFPPDFLSRKIEKGMRLGTPFTHRKVKGLLTDWVQFQNRKRFTTEWWNLQVEDAVRLTRQTLRDEIEKNTGRNILSKSELDFIEDEIKRIRYVGNKEIGPYILGLGKKPTWAEKWQAGLFKRLDLIEMRKTGIFGLGGVPIDGWEKLSWSKSFVNQILKLFYDIPQLYKIVTAPLHWARSAWIRQVLYWRAAWAPRNAYTDGLRAAYGGGGISYWAKDMTQYMLGSAQYYKKIAGNLAELPKEVADRILNVFKLSTLEADEIEKLAGKGYGKWLKRQLTTISKDPFDTFSFEKTLMAGKKGIGPFLNKKLWKWSGLDNLIDFETALKMGPLKTPAGEFISAKALKYLAGNTLAGTVADPAYVRKIVSYLPETNLWQRFWKRLRVLDADTLLYNDTLENLRRVTLVYDLIFKKGMSLAQTKAKVWGFMFNYSDLTLVGRIFRTFFPFYAFNSNIVKMYLRECLKQGPRAYFAAQVFLTTWSKATEDLPEFYRDRIPIGNKMYWRPWASVFEILNFAREPGKALIEWADNPLRAPLGFGLDPAWTTFIGAATEKKYFDISAEIKDMTGMTQYEIDRYIENEQIKKDISGKENIGELIFTFFPMVKLVKVLFDTDAKMAADGISWLKSNKVREWMKYFGLNIVKWDDVERFRYILYEAPPRLRTQVGKELEAENPEVWRLLNDQFAKAAFIKAYNAKPDERQEALEDLHTSGVLATYFGAEEVKEGSGKLWLERNPDAKKIVETFFNEQEMTPWRMYARAKYNMGVLESEVYSATEIIYKKEVVDKAEILGITIPYGIIGDKSEFLNQFFDERGNLKIATRKEMEIIMGKGWVDNFFSKEKIELQTLIEDRARDRYHEWLYEKVQGTTLEDRRFAEKMSNWYAILPDNIDKLPEDKSNILWSAYWDYFEKYFTEEDKEKYFQSLEPWYAEYRKKIRDYIKIWGSLVSKFGEKDFQFFSEFRKAPQWFQDLYFYKYPNKKLWYPFAEEWITKLFNIEQEENKTFIVQTEKRKEASAYFWSHEDLIRLWDQDNPGLYNYMKTWQKIMIVTEDNPEEYFPLFYSQPLEFRERFFKKNPNKRVYYEFLRTWVGLIQEDKNNWEDKGIRSTKAKDYFWSEDNKHKREAYAKDKLIAPGKSILDYLKAWDEIFYQTEDNIENYFPLFYSQPDWFIKHFFSNNPNKEIYYPVIQEWIKRINKDTETLEKTGMNPNNASKYYQKHIKEVKKIREAWEAENPGVIEYLDTWAEIIKKTEKNPEIYFDEFYKQSESFRERFFKNNKNKAIYYPVIRKWVNAIKQDKKNWEEKQKKTYIARDYFDSWKNTETGKLYAKDNMITANKSIIDYLELWIKVSAKTEENPGDFFAIFNVQPDWFKDHYFSNNPLKKDYYWFAKELGEQKPETFSDFFWKRGEKYEVARQAWDKDNPGFLDYMQFWKKLGSLAKLGQWDLYFDSYFSSQNEEFRLRHLRNHPEAEERYKAMQAYQKLPSITWENRKAKRAYLKAHPLLIEWWAKDLSNEDAKIRGKVEEYYSLLDNIPDDGFGRSYFIEVRKWQVAAENFIKENPEVLIFLQKQSGKYTGDKPDIINIAHAYFELDFPFQKTSYLIQHPELKEYFNNLNAPGIRKILELQGKYFALDDKYKAAYLDIHPELIDYWEVMKLPWSYWNEPSRFQEYQKAVSKIEKCFDAYSTKNWVTGETLRLSLPSIFQNPGDSVEDDWFRYQVYSLAMKTWSTVSRLNSFFAVYFFRQLPRWIRDSYYEKHPEKKYLSKEPLSRFIEESLRIYENINPDLVWAYKMIYKYGKNIPSSIYKKVRSTMVKAGQWKDRANWTQKDWDNYWKKRALELNQINKWDFEHLPLLQVELRKVQRQYPLRINPSAFRAPKVGVIHPFF